MVERATRDPRHWPVRGAVLALLAVSVLHGLSPLLLRGPHAGYGWDESVYISQIDPRVPALFFDPPRARGLTLLTAPAAYLSGSVAVMRVWLSIVSAAGMVLGFLPWLRLRRGIVVALAAGLFSSLWVAIYYSYEAMPNQYVGYGALAAIGWLLVAMGESGRRRDLVYSAVAVAFTALIRPSDALFLLLPLLAAVLLVHGVTRRRRAVLVACLLAGYAAGVAEWIAEAYARFGGPVHRLALASAENTGGLHWSLGAEFRALGGPILCRGSCLAGSPLSTQLWWFALVPLVALGVLAVRRTERPLRYLLPIAAAVSLAAQYMVFIAYPAPRFLEPSYALLALPVAEGFRWLGTHLPAPRQVAIAAVAGVLAIAEVPQAHALQRASTEAQQRWIVQVAIARYLHRHGITGDCYVGGAQQPQIAIETGCHQTWRNPLTVRGILADTDAAVAVVGYRSIMSSVAATLISHPGLEVTRVDHAAVCVLRAHGRAFLPIAHHHHHDRRHRSLRA